MTSIQVQTSAGSSQLNLDKYEQGSTAIAALTDAYGGLTGSVRLLSTDVEEGRRGIRSLDLDHRTTLKAMLSTGRLLEELSTDRGLMWSEIAKLCEVNVSTVRKWRAGDSISSDGQRALARLAAFLDLLSEVGPIDEPASWLNMWLVDHLTVNAADIYIAGQADDLLEHAQGHLGLEELLDRWNSNWRDMDRSDWIIVVGPDGERVLTRR